MITFQNLIKKLDCFWEKYGCLLWFPYDIEKGAGTFNPATFLMCLGPKAWSCAYVEPTRRPTDGRYGENPNRLQHYYQYQVVIKPPPNDIQKIYLKSLKFIGLNPQHHDIKFVEDDWESPTLGAWGLGWEVWLDGMEITQFTYFQQIGNIDLNPITVELTYGLERIAIFLQKKKNVFEIIWHQSAQKNITYGDIHKQNEIQFSKYNFEVADTTVLKRHFQDWETETNKLLDLGLLFPAYDCVMKCSHIFNLLDARGVLSRQERTDLVNRVRKLSNMVALEYLKNEYSPI